MMADKRFFLYADEEQFPRENAQAIEQAMLGFVKSDVNLAVEISFVCDKEIRALNAQTRGIDKVTDVLSYPALDNISVRKQANRNIISEKKEIFISHMKESFNMTKEECELYL